MTIAKRINYLVLVITVMAAIFVLLFSAQRQYLGDRDQLLQGTVSHIRSQSQLQYEIYSDNLGALGRDAAAITNISPAIRYTTLNGADGAILVDNGLPIPGGMPDVKALRSGVSPVEASRTLSNGGQLGQSLPLLSLALTRAEYLHQTIPIHSLINPLESDLSRGDFERALMAPAEANSLHVIGYAHVVIDRQALLLAGLPKLLPLLGACVLFVLLCMTLARRITRKITAPLTRLQQLAGDIADGRVSSRSDIGDSGEMREIVNTLDLIMGDLSDYRSRISVDHRLLSLKVEERTEQLSRRNQELNRAVREVTRTKNQLRELAYFDALTSLPNRRLFSEQLALLIRLAMRNQQTLGLMFLDLDNFKRINDSLGHRAGDLLLKEVARRLSSCVRESDVVAHYVDSDSRIDVSRLGGDEFTVVLNQLASEEAAGLVARRIIETLTKPMTIDEHEIVVTPSIGIAIVPRDGSDVDEVLRCADTAMYHAKSSGKNNYLYYSPEMDAAGVDRLRLENDLRKAVERGQMHLHYQPQVDTVTGSVIGAEALMRWHHPDLGDISPGQFIPVAEESGLIGELGDWALDSACAQMVAWDQDGISLDKVSVNVSATQFSDKFTHRLQEVLETHGLEAQRLQLEITEGMVMEDTASTIGSLREIKALGVRLSIDDFGTGYSSLSYLSHFPLDELKIDRSFVMDIGKSDNDDSLVIAIIAMARSMGLELVAEGVETDVQYHFLSQHDAKVIQGFLFSGAVPADKLQHLMDPFHFMGQIQGMPRPLAASAQEGR